MHRLAQMGLKEKSFRLKEAAAHLARSSMDD